MSLSEISFLFMTIVARLLVRWPAFVISLRVDPVFGNLLFYKVQFRIFRIINFYFVTAFLTLATDNDHVPVCINQIDAW